MKQDYYCKEREVFTMAFVKKTWKDRIAEFPTRRRLTKEDNTSELVTVAREEGTLSQEGDAFSAENMNDLENRIDAEFTEVNGKLHYKEKNTIIKNNGIAITQTSSDEPFVCPSDGYITADSAIGITNQTVVATTSGVPIVTARSNGNYYGSDCAYVRKGMQLFLLAKTGSAFFYPLE